MLAEKDAGKEFVGRKGSEIRREEGLSTDSGLVELNEDLRVTALDCTSTSSATTCGGNSRDGFAFLLVVADSTLGRSWVSEDTRFVDDTCALAVS